MDHKQEIRDFLVTRRGRITPQQAGLPAFGGNRRVSGLRREEVAMLAGVSVDYYTRLERGNLGGVSESVLEALASALRLDDAERAHLFDLARAASRPARASRQVAGAVRPQVQWLLDRMSDAPAYVRNHRFEVLAGNALGRALYAPIFAMERPNLMRFTFLDPKARTFFIDWDAVAASSTATLRGLAGQYPQDKAMHDLVGELCTRSETFAALWARHDVRQHRSGTKRVHHSVVGDLSLQYESLQLTSEPGLVLNAYTAEPGSADAQALALLASWSASEYGIATTSTMTTSTMTTSTATTPERI